MLGAIDAEVVARANVLLSRRRFCQNGSDQVEIIRILKVANDSVAEGKTWAINQIKAPLFTALTALCKRLA
jgi:hypothetical protein